MLRKPKSAFRWVPLEDSAHEECKTVAEERDVSNEIYDSLRGDGEVSDTYTNAGGDS